MWLIAHRTPATAAACSGLADAGATVFEVDVRWSPAGLVVSHFADVPVTGGRIEHDNWRLRRVREHGRDPLLAERIDMIPAGAQVLLDLKEERVDRRRLLVDALGRQFGGDARFVVSSPDQDDLAAVRAAGLRTWQTLGSRAAVAELLHAPAAAGPDEALTVRHSLITAALVDAVHGSGRAIVGWTVNSAATARRLAGLGVDGVTTDRHAVLRQLRG